jgi:hypothetical protein
VPDREALPRQDDSDDFRDLTEGRIESDEYVRRLNERVKRNREQYGYHTPTGAKFLPRPVLSEPHERARRGFWRAFWDGFWHRGAR